MKWSLSPLLVCEILCLILLLLVNRIAWHLFLIKFVFTLLLHFIALFTLLLNLSYACVLHEGLILYLALFFRHCSIDIVTSAINQDLNVTDSPFPSLWLSYYIYLIRFNDHSKITHCITCEIARYTMRKQYFLANLLLGLCTK